VETYDNLCSMIRKQELELAVTSVDSSSEALAHCKTYPRKLDVSSPEIYKIKNLSLGILSNVLSYVLANF